MIRDYIIKEKLGTGSYGVVYKVTKKTDRNIYVLKQISLFGLSKNQIDEVKNEAKILSQLNSDYVVKYYDSFEEKNFLNIVMEFCDGGDLGGFIEAQKKTGTLLNEEVIWKLFIKTCIGLAYLHKRKILHRDLKALNIFLTKDLEVKIGDLGVAKVLTACNFAKTFIGTPYYLSPEICEERPYNEKSDVWALGCILYELCSFKHPFNANSQGALILKIMNGKYEPVSMFYSNDIRRMVEVMLEKNDKVRPSIFDIMKGRVFYEKAKVYGLSQCVIKVFPDNRGDSGSSNGFDKEKKMKQSGQITLVDLKFNGENNEHNGGNSSSNSPYPVFKGNKLIIKKSDRPGSAIKSNIVIKGKQIGLGHHILNPNSNTNSDHNSNEPNTNLKQTKQEGGNGVIQIPHFNPNQQPQQHPQSAKKKYIKITPVKKTDICPNANDAFSKDIEVNKQIEKYNQCYNKNQQMAKKANNLNSNPEFILPIKVDSPTPVSNFKYLKKIIIKDNKPKQEGSSSPSPRPSTDLVKEGHKEELLLQLEANAKKSKDKVGVEEEDKRSEIDTAKNTITTVKTIKPENDVHIPHPYNNKEHSKEIGNEGHKDNEFAIIANPNANGNEDDFAVIDNPDFNITQSNPNAYSSDSSDEEPVVKEHNTNANANVYHSKTNKEPQKALIGISEYDNEDDDYNEEEEETVKLFETVIAKPTPSQSQTKNELLERRKTLITRFNGLKAELSNLIGEEDAKHIYDLYKRTEALENKEDEIIDDIQQFINKKYSSIEEEVSDIPLNTVLVKFDILSIDVI